MKKLTIIATALALVCAACETTTPAAPPSLVELQDATVEQCPSGGTVVVTGVDADRSGALEAGEIAATRVICNGEDGRMLVRVSKEPAGANCASGGTRIESGLDADGDGELAAGEVTDTQFACDGEDGQTSLIRSDAEPAGEHCGEGGTRVSSGLDDNGNGVLDDDEIDQTEYVCNGLPGSGMNSLVSVLEEAAGPNCAHGGFGLRSGLDVNGDFLLQPGEVQSTVYVCNGADGLTSLIRREDEPAGGNCPHGGQAVLTGVDSDGNGYLDDMEAQSTSFVCHGADGSNGVSNLFETSPEPAGATCAAGGLWILSGPDSDADGVLDSDEIQVEEVVCNGLDGIDGTDGYNSLVRVTVEAVGANCAAGGRKIETGLDLDRDGVLDAGEVTQTQYVCHGADGSDGLSSLVTVTVEAAGANCATGGLRVQGGLDADADGVLDAGEVTQSQYVCDGADGLNGLDGTDGLTSLVLQTVEAAGVNCVDGGTKLQSGLDLDADGVLDVGEVLQTQYVCHGGDGSNGLTALVRQTAEAAGANCATGGTKLESGLDANVNGTLDSAEIAQTRYICNGIHGADGSDGLTSLVRVTAETAGVNCVDGGTKVQSGLDLNASGVLDVGEITATQYVCHGADGADGSDGLTSLVRVTVEAAGVNCADGGLKLESGLDTNASGVLDAGEITATQYVCHGADGLDGLDGSDGLAGINSLVALTVEPAGVNCATGGTMVQSGLDADLDGTLDVGEVTQTRYVCNGAAGSDGSDGLTSLVALTVEPAGVNCAAGGTKVESGADTDGDTTLDAVEVTSTQYVCHGEDGDDLLLRASNAAWGGVCTFGGVKLETGVDANANGVLDDPEVTTTQYVCNRNNRPVSILAGSRHACALMMDGVAWCWGDNTYGQLGDGTTTRRLVPTQVAGIGPGVASIIPGGFYSMASYHHTCAVKTDGSAWCWGANLRGQLGDGTTTQRLLPTPVIGLDSGVASIASGGQHTCCRKVDGSAWCWGRNFSGELGDGTNDNRLLPVPVSALGTEVSSVSAGTFHTCAVKTNGSAWCWGGNIYGGLGDGSVNDSNVPVNVSGFGSGVSMISAGHFHTCALKTEGSAWCWGYNADGQLGDGTMIDRTIPTKTVDSFGFTTIAASRGQHTCAVRLGALHCWGSNLLGQLGDGTTTRRLVPTLVAGLGGNGVISGGEMFTCMLDNDGKAWCWGDNAYGQLGDGTITNSIVPVEVMSFDLAP